MGTTGGIGVRDGARTGYVSSSAVAAIDPLPAPWIAIATNDGDPSVGGVQAYRAPSLGGPMAASYRLGSRFTVLGAVAGDAVESSTSRWYRVVQGSLSPLYLYAAYLKFTRLGASVVPAPQITATAAVAMDRASGRILYRLDATRRLRPASTVKLMTALVALSRSKPETRMIVPDDVYTVTADVGGSAMGLAPGEVLSLHDLLYGMLLPSGNDAAYAIAQNIGGSQRGFAAMMNAQAARLGLRDTHFTNSTGLDEVGEHTSAQDLARLTRYVLRKDSLVARIVRHPPPLPFRPLPPTRPSTWVLGTNSWASTRGQMASRRGPRTGRGRTWWHPPAAAGAGCWWWCWAPPTATRTRRRCWTMRSPSCLCRDRTIAPRRYQGSLGHRERSARRVRVPHPAHHRTSPGRVADRAPAGRSPLQAFTATHRRPASVPRLHPQTPPVRKSCLRGLNNHSRSIPGNGGAFPWPRGQGVYLVATLSRGFSSDDRMGDEYGTP